MIHPRVFQSPYLRTTETVSLISVLGAFFIGPLYYWRKKAPIEALLFGTACLIVLVVPDVDWEGFSDFDLSFAVWAVFALAAPILLPFCYLRKGWIEVT